MVNLAGKLGSGAGSEDGTGTGHPGVKQGSPGHQPSPGSTIPAGEGRESEA